MSLEGVLGGRTAFDITMQPDPRGQYLFNVLQTAYRVVLVTDQTEPVKAEHWLRSNLLHGHSQLLTAPLDAIGTQAVRIAQLRALRASRATVDLFVDPNAEAVGYAARVGITALRWTYPLSGADREDLRTNPIRSWEDMVPDDPRIPQ